MTLLTANTATPGTAWVFGDHIDTDVLAPGQYMKFGIEIIASHCLESVEPRFAREVKPGDVVVGGRNFGAGSSREQAAQALKQLGVAAVLAPSFGGIFYRNALNAGLPVMIFADGARIAVGDALQVDIETGRILNLRSGEALACEPIPAHLAPMLRDGGLLAHLQKRLAGAGPPVAEHE